MAALSLDVSKGYADQMHCTYSSREPWRMAVSIFASTLQVADTTYAPRPEYPSIQVHISGRAPFVPCCLE